MLGPQTPWKIQHVVILAVLWIAGGCNPATHGPEANPSSTPGTTTPISNITPIDFFSPEQKRLSQHLNWHTGCFKIESINQKGTIRYQLELWRQGILTERSAAFGIGSTTTTIPEQGELSIAISDEQTRFRVTHAFYLGGTGGSSEPRFFNKPNLENSSTSVVQIRSKLELQRGKEVVPWAYMIHKSTGESQSNRNPDHQIIEQVRNSEWALVLKIGLDMP